MANSDDTSRADLREKLIAIIHKIYNDPRMDFYDLWEMNQEADTIADIMIENCVTVQDEKPLEAFLHPIDAYDGLKAKYLVFKADTGTKVENCFVLRPDKDPAAVEALRAYANATDNETLAADIYNWVGKGVTVQEWIPVTEQELPGPGKVLTTDGERVYLTNGAWFYRAPDGKIRIPANYGAGADVTHWMPLPELPKGVH